MSQRFLILNYLNEIIFFNAHPCNIRGYIIQGPLAIWWYHTLEWYYNQCYFQLSPGSPPESQIPQKNTQNTKNIRKCIEFTPQICVSPRTWSLELTLIITPTSHPWSIYAAHVSGESTSSNPSDLWVPRGLHTCKMLYYTKILHLTFLSSIYQIYYGVWTGNSNYWNQI